MLPPLRIPARFNGPDGSGNGGYSSGLLAARLGGSDVEVRLAAPPPLDRDLTVREEDGGSLSLLDGTEPVATARRRSVEIEVPERVGVDEAAAAALNYPGFVRHAFPRCFVCGVERPDGLKLRPSPVPGRGVFATPGTPDPALCPSGGEAPVEFVWAALDCPSGWATDQRVERVAVLGTLAARLIAPVRAGEEHVVVSWYRGGEGRKHLAGSAVLDAAGEACAVAESVWILVGDL